MWDKPGCRTIEEAYTLSSSDRKTFKCESFEVEGTLLQAIMIVIFHVDIYFCINLLCSRTQPRN